MREKFPESHEEKLDYLRELREQAIHAHDEDSAACLRGPCLLPGWCFGLRSFGLTAQRHPELFLTDFVAPCRGKQLLGSIESEAARQIL